MFRRGEVGAALRLPVVGVFRDGEALFGVGNAVAMLDWKFLEQERLGSAVGAQLELPTASDEDFGDAHWLVLPYLRTSIDRGSFDANLHLGGAQTIGDGSGGHEGHHHSHSHAHEQEGFVINDHAPTEFLGRLELGRSAQGVRVPMRGAVLLDMVAPLGSESVIGSLGLAMDVMAGDNVLRLMGMGSPMESQRSAYRVGFSITHATEWFPSWL